jgi:ATP-dependent Clp protease ATP-binding subunit ClpC
LGEKGMDTLAIAESLARRINKGDAPGITKQIKLLNIAKLSELAYDIRSELEEQIRTVINFIKTNNLILLVGNLFSLAEVEATEPIMIAANTLKTAVHLGEIQVICTADISDYHAYLENDVMLKNCFSLVMVEEPGPENVIKILQGTKNSLEEYHLVNITDEAIRTAVELAVRHIPEGHLPAKAYDLLDEASTIIRLKSGVAVPEIKAMHARLKKVIGLKDETVETQQFETAAEKLVASDLAKDKFPVVTKEAVISVMSGVTILPSPQFKSVSKLNQSAHKVLLSAEDIAKLLNRNQISAEHILLAMLREGDNTAADILKSFGITLEQLRQKVVEENEKDK